MLRGGENPQPASTSASPLRYTPGRCASTRSRPLRKVRLQGRGLRRGGRHASGTPGWDSRRDRLAGGWQPRDGCHREARFLRRTPTLRQEPQAGNLTIAAGGLLRRIRCSETPTPTQPRCADPLRFALGSLQGRELRRFCRRASRKPGWDSRYDNRRAVAKHPPACHGERFLRSRPGPGKLATVWYSEYGIASPAQNAGSQRHSWRGCHTPASVSPPACS